MLIAQQKKQENIAEYILYMYQVEDLIRAYQFDIDNLMDKFVNPQLSDKTLEDQYRNWYEGLIKQMRIQGIEKSGHLSELKEVLVELSYLHNTLLNLANDHKYKGLMEYANPYIEEFKGKSNLKDKNHIEVIFHALYMKLLLRLQKKDISVETEEAFDAMRAMLAYLSKSYHQMKAGNLDFLNN